MDAKLLTSLQEIYFDLCDLLDSGDVDDISISEPAEFETLREFLVEQRNKLLPYTAYEGNA
jgi:hypothetical protein